MDRCKMCTYFATFLWQDVLGQICATHFFTTAIFEKSWDALLAAMRRCNCTDRHVFWCRFARWVDYGGQIALLSKLVAPATPFLPKQRSFWRVCTCTSLEIKNDALQPQQKDAADDAQSNEVPITLQFVLCTDILPFRVGGFGPKITPSLHPREQKVSL